jgi:hypothetical protein
VSNAVCIFLIKSLGPDLSTKGIITKEKTIVKLNNNNKALIPNKLGWTRNETQSENIEIKGFKYKKTMIIIVKLKLN